MKYMGPIWYHRHARKWGTILLPLAGVFAAVSQLRRILYQAEWLPVTHFDLPVIIVGNITVGGAGKTPFVIWLAHFLKSQGWRPGIVTRGVGGQRQMAPILVTTTASTDCVGDEAVLLAKRSDAPVVVCIDRVAAVKKLLANTDCNIVLADDGLQHYRLARDLEIVLVDKERRFGNGYLLPAGPLREPISRLKQADYVLYHGKKALGEWNMQLQGDQAISLIDDTIVRPLHYFSQMRCHAVAAIGHPQRFFTSLRDQGLNIKQHIFRDHYRFQAKDFAFEDNWPIIMTEKDAVKCQTFVDERFWFVPVSAQVDEIFAHTLVNALKTLKQSGENHHAR